MAALWYTRLAEVPGVGYPGSEQVDRLRLRGHDARPTVTTLDNADTEERSFFMWPTKGGSTSESPASRRASNLEELSTGRVLSTLAEALELPGTVSNYVYVIEKVAEELWSRRRNSPELIYDKIEELCLLNLRIVEVWRDCYQVTAFQRLALLYECEGAWREAIATADLAARLNQDRDPSAVSDYDDYLLVKLGDRSDELRRRLAAQESEIGDGVEE